MVLGGSCLCGGVRFEVELPFRRANHCHCSLCRTPWDQLPEEGLRRYPGPPDADS